MIPCFSDSTVYQVHDTRRTISEARYQKHKEEHSVKLVYHGCDILFTHVCDNTFIQDLQKQPLIVVGDLIHISITVRKRTILVDLGADIIILGPSW